MLKTTRNVVSIILSIALILSMTPISAFAADSNPLVSGEITAFAPLDESVANQSYENVEQMNLNWIEPPETLTATVRLADDETASPATTGGGEITTDIPVEWDMTLSEETAEGGRITRFTAVIGAGFTLAQDVELPTVTVTVAQIATVEIDPMTVATPLTFTSGAQNSVSSPEDGYVWNGEDNILTLSGLILHIDHTSAATAALVLPANSTIDLADGTHNEVYINRIDDANTLSAIIGQGALTIKGSGKLVVNSANSDNSNVAGAVGISSYGNLTIEGGEVEVTAQSVSSTALTVAAIDAAGLSITGGTVTAKSSLRALKNDYTVPAGHSYWKSEDTYTQGATKYVSTGNATNDKIDSSTKNVKIVAGINYVLRLESTNGKFYKNNEINAANDVTDVITDLGAEVTGSSGAWTLTLTNFEFETTAPTALLVPADTTIVLEGDNTITTISSDLGTNGIYSYGSLTISGDGVLTASGGTNFNGSIGISSNALTISGGTVIATGASQAFEFDYTVPAGYSYWRNTDRVDPADDVTISTGSETEDKISTHRFAKIVAESGNNYTLLLYSENGRLYKNDVESSNDVTAEMAAAGAVVSGSFGARILTLTNFEFETSAADALVVPGGTTIVLANGTTSTLTSTGSNSGIRSLDTLTITGSTGILNATGSYAGIRGSTITISGGTVTATGVRDSGSSYGIAYNSQLHITGGTVTAIGNSNAFGGEGPDTLPSSYEYWTNTVASDSGATKGTGSYTWNASHKYVKIVAAGSGTGTDHGTGTGTGTSSSSNSSSSSSSSSATPAPAAPVITPMNDKSSGTLNNAINAAANATNSDGNSLGVILKNVSNFTKENAAAILKKAKALGKKATVSSDIMSEDGKFVEVRVTLDPALITRTVRLDGYIRESQTIATGLKFNKHFENKTAVVYLGQDGKFGQAAKIAAKVDLKDFNTANLFIYSYDKETNKYTLITSTDYKIDKNGYLVFNTELGGNIIISDGRLLKK